MSSPEYIVFRKINITLYIIEMTEYYTLGQWDTNGVPKYLTTNNSDEEVSDFIDRFRKFLPRKTNVVTKKPNLINDTRTRNILIQSTDPSFNGVDVKITFLHEDAGYRNTLGYYVYELRNGYTVPTKLVNGSYVPMTYSDRNSVDASGKSILKKTIIFPNASYPGGGGGLKSGATVRLLYDTTDSTKKFPNNTGIGFFLIPNGWNGTTFVNTAERIHSDSVFNSGGVQTILVNDAFSSDEYNGKKILSFEDIMRPGGDSSFDDVIFSVSCTPNKWLKSDDSSDEEGLGAKITISTTNVCADQTGVYIQMPDSTCTSLKNANPNSYWVQHKIRATSNKYHTILKNVFKKCIFENDFYINDSDDDDDDTSGNPTSFKVKCNLPKTKLSNYVYLMKSSENRETTSYYDEKVRNIVDFQNFYVFGGSNVIHSESLSIKDGKSTNSKDDADEYISTPVTLNKEKITSPLSMGDPHVTTIKGITHNIPDSAETVELLTSNNLEIFAKISQYPNNRGFVQYEKLKFMEIIYLRNGSEHIYIDLFNENTYYSNYSNLEKTNLPHWLNEVVVETHEIKERRNHYTKLFRNSPYNIKYLEFSTMDLGNVVLELVFIPYWKDRVNSFSILSKALMITPAKGAFIDTKNYDINIQFPTN